MTTASRQVLEQLVSLLAPVMHLHEALTLSLWQRASRRFRAGLNGLRRGKVLGVPAGLVTALCLVVALFLLDGTHRVGAKAALEGQIHRAVVAPYDGYIEQAHARAGEEVTQSQVLAELDDESLQLEYRRWQGQKEEFNKQYRRELASLNHPKAQILKAQIAQADAQLKLVESKLARTRLTAPIDGIVVKGDLSRALGAPVKKGEVLFEVAPLNAYRIVLKISERDIPHVKRGQTGQLRLKAYPDQTVPFEIYHIAALHQEDGAEAWFRTEARLQPTDLVLRPGMEGIGKVEVGSRSYIWLGLHRVIDWLRYWFWSWSP